MQYIYDGLQRLTNAVESPGASFAYGYDQAGNRTSVAVNGSTQATYQYDAANQVQGWTYDAAGNLTGDGTTTHTFDALNRLTGTTATGQTRAYAQDLAGGLSQILARGHSHSRRDSNRRRSATSHLLPRWRPSGAGGSGSGRLANG